MERGLAADHTTDGQPTTPVASGAIGEPLQRHEASAQMIRGEVGETAQQGPIAQGPTAAEQMGHVDDVRGEPAEQTPFAEPPARTAARMHTPSREGVARTGENRVFTTTELLPGTNNRPLEIESRAQPEIPAEPSMTGPLGHWPVAADDPHAAGKYVEGEEQVATGTTEGATHIPIVTATGEPASVYDEELAREQMLGNERPPYENTGDDLQRVGATTKLAPWATLPTWDQAAPHYREQWQNRAGASGGRWEDVEPGYRYGYEMAAEPRHHGRQWSEAEPELRAAYSDWSQRCGYRGSNWTDMRERAREAWENVQGNGEGMTDPESRRIE